MKWRLTFLFVLLSSSALAQQQQPDQAMLQRVIQVLQSQRNEAYDKAAAAEARAAQMAEELQKLKTDAEKPKPPATEHKP